MTSRRNFLASAAVGTTLAGVGFGGLTASAQSTTTSDPTKSAKASAESLPKNPETEKFRPTYKYGMGGAPLSHADAERPNSAILETVEGAWDMGTRYFDTSPWYNLGLGERRFGVFLHDKPRQEYVISTKVGRILHPDASVGQVAAWQNPPPMRHEYDYTADGVRRSIEDSLQRMGTSYLDIVFIHDLCPSNGDFTGDDYETYYRQATEGAMPELTRMRDEGIIKAWGLGVNTLDPSTRAFEVADPDIILQACKYSLIDHQDTIERLFPLADRTGASVVVGSPLNNGFLTGRNRYNYGPGFPEGALDKRARLNRIAIEQGVDIRTAALQFAAAPKTVSAIIPGARSYRQAIENAQSMRETIPAAFWQQLKSEGLISELAATPA